MQKLTSNLWQAIKKFCEKSGWFIIAPLCASSLSTFISHIWTQRFSFVHEQSCVGSIWPGLRSELHPPAPPAALSHRQILLSYIWKITTLTISLKCTLISIWIIHADTYADILIYSHSSEQICESSDHICERKLTHGYLKWLTHSQNLSPPHTHKRAHLLTLQTFFYWIWWQDHGDPVKNTVWMIQPVVFVGPHTHWRSVTSDSDMCGPL